jgi:hypothetical protein
LEHALDVEDMAALFRANPVLGVHWLKAESALPGAGVDKYIDIAKVLEIRLHRLKPLLGLCLVATSTWLWQCVRRFGRDASGYSHGPFRRSGLNASRIAKNAAFGTTTTTTSTN